jgi:hypothetical protein
MRIFDFVLSKDGERMFAIANVIKLKAAGETVRPTASRLPLPASAATTYPDLANDISIDKLQRNLVIYDLAGGETLA